MNEKNEKKAEKSLVINASSFETRIALLENSNIAELFIERLEDKSLLGNIYKGYVTRVLPGMNAAFVDIGIHRSAFLFGGDAFDITEGPSHADTEHEFDHLEESINRLSKRPIEQVLHDGQQIIVQVSKEALGSKGPRVTMYLTIPGRFLVFMPGYPHLGLSRRIEEEAERDRLKTIIKKHLPSHSGAIVRTAAKQIDEENLKNELLYLMHLWGKIEHNIQYSKAPSQLYCDIDLIKKVTRDLCDENLKKIIIDDKDSHSELDDFLHQTFPQHIPELELYEDRKPIFDAFDLEIDIAKALSKKVELPSGGYLIIDQTEALTSFDVNTGKFVGKYSSRQTILKTNMEAVVKVVQQLRLRNIGGIIILDLIDMEHQEDREEVFEFLQQTLKSDRSRTNVLRISEFGLVQMTRKRTADSLGRLLMESCPFCEGKGVIRSVKTESHDLLREILRSSVQTGQKKIKVRVRKEIEQRIKEKLKTSLYDLKKYHDIDVEFLPSLLDTSLLTEPAYEI